MTWLVGAITSVVSVVVFLETMEDTLHSRYVTERAMMSGHSVASE